MDLKVDALPAARKSVEDALDVADEAAAALARALGNLKLVGLREATKAGVHPSLAGRVFHYLGKAEAHSSGVIAALGGLHFELHAVMERLDPQNPNPTPQGGGGGGKGDKPPPPVE